MGPAASNRLIEAGSSFSFVGVVMSPPIIWPLTGRPPRPFLPTPLLQPTPFLPMALPLGDRAGGEGEDAELNGVSTELDTELGGGNTAPGNTKLSYGPECLLLLL